MSALTSTAGLARFRRVQPAPAGTQRILTVWFRAPGGRVWNTIGGGDTVAAAIAFARDSCPLDSAWRLVGWDDVYGD